jgi:hypothetical protein
MRTGTSSSTVLVMPGLLAVGRVRAAGIGTL